MRRHLYAGHHVKFTEPTHPGDYTYYYEIDDPKIHNRVGITYESIADAFENYDYLAREALALGARTQGRKKIIPFSDAVDAKTGACLEKAILVQLAFQQTKPIFLVHGWRERDGVKSLHAFNLVMGTDRRYLIDVSNLCLFPCDIDFQHIDPTGQIVTEGLPFSYGIGEIKPL